MKKGKMVTYLVVGLLVLYILYLMFRATKLKTKETKPIKPIPNESNKKKNGIHIKKETGVKRTNVPF